MSIKDGASATGSKLLKGATILGIAAVVSKLMGTLQKIPLQNIGGDQTFGVYSAVYPFYILIMFLATAGFPVAVSKFVSERTAQGNERGARRVLYVSSMILMLTGLLFFCILFFGAGLIAGWIHNDQTKPAIQSAAFALLFVPQMASLRGYFQGRQNMVPTAISQVIEQGVRVAVMLMLLLYLHAAHYPDSWIAAGATFGSAAGALAGLAYMLYCWFKELKNGSAERLRGQAEEKDEPLFPLVKQIVYYALPICLGSIVVPILNIVDSFTMPRLLHLHGLSMEAAMVQFGVYNRGLTLVQLVSMIAGSVAVAIVPSIAEAKAVGSLRSIRIRTELSVRLTWLLGLASSAGLAMTAYPVNVMLYKNTEGTAAIAILAFTALFSTLNITSASILQGMGSVLIPAVNMLLSTALKAVLNVALLPVWGINGTAAATVLAFAMAAILNIIALTRRTGVRFSPAHYLYKPMLAIIGMCVLLFMLIHGSEAALRSIPVSMTFRQAQTIVSLIAVGGGALAFFLLIFRVGVIDAKDLESVPNAGRKLLPLLIRFRLLGRPQAVQKK
ncbi:putative polysaccharide biosynthesis protein [Ferviditalea candida]|uniref:Polysaccharide biosynthesis protein n=1 Tax=Ferviditalea candida TaxID=3108399 RepID=A0ABU5ZM50_9BACL|nr:polysaccharide biosynthesis protein [Paenibacillaceae bacterium T2]